MNQPNQTFNFGSSPFAKNNQSTGLFNQNTPGSSGGLFGMPQNNTFGNTAGPSSQGLPTPSFGTNLQNSFGNQSGGFSTGSSFQPQTGTGFGGFQTSIPQSSPFCQSSSQGQTFQQATPQPSLFNNPTQGQNVVNQSPFSSAFTSQSQPQLNSGQGSIFGQQNNPSMFSSSSQPSGGFGTGLFSSSTNQTSSFTSGFGSTSQASGSLFKPTTGFGGQQTGFGSQQTQPFGLSSQQSTTINPGNTFPSSFGSSTSQPFGNFNTPSMQGGSGFGGNITATCTQQGFSGLSAFSKPATSFGGFGNTSNQQQGGLFSQQTPNTGGIGTLTNTQNTSTFGSQPSSFGNQIGGTGFGSSQTSFSFGNQQSGGFTGLQSNTFGTQGQQSTGLFGSGTGASTFGSQPTSSWPQSSSTNTFAPSSSGGMSFGQSTSQSFGGFSSGFGANKPLFGSSATQPATGSFQGSGQTSMQSTFGSSGFNAPVGQNEFDEASRRFQYHLKLGNVANANEDYVVPNPPTDTITKLRFSPKSDLLMCSSWDGSVRCWEANSSTQQIFPKICQNLQDAVAFDINWNPDGTQLFMACSDNTGKLWDLGSNSITQIARHELAVRTINYIQTPKFTCVMTGSWDKTLCFWDLRSPTPINRFDVTEKIFAADFSYPYAVLSTSNRGIVIYRIDSKISEFKKYTSSLKYQHRSLCMFKDGKNSSPSGFAVGSVAGRVAIEYVASSNSSFTFKCHRSELTNDSNVQDLYPVHDIKCHPIHGTLVTAGGDGYLGMWDKNKRARLKTFKQCSLPITCCDISSNGELLSYAIGYDWSRGFLAYDRENMKPAVFVRLCSEDMKPHRF